MATTTNTKTTETEEKVTTKKATASEKDQEISDLKAQIAQMQAMLQGFMAGQNFAAQQTTSAPSKLYDEIVLVHLAEMAPGLTTHIQLSNLSIDLRSFGEERSLTTQQFEECVGKYRKWFEDGILAVGKGGEDAARRYALKTADQYNVGRDFLAKLPTLDVYQLEALYAKLGKGHQSFILEYWKRKVIAKDPVFLNRQKIEVLNRLSDGGMKDIILSLDTKATLDKVREAK